MPPNEKRHRCGVPDPADLIGPLLRTTYREMVARLETQFAGTELSLAQWIALKLIRDGEAATVSDVATELGHTGGATTRLVDHLERRGLIDRVRHRHDRRIVSLVITDTGRDVAGQIEIIVRAFWKQQMSAFSASDASTLVELLARFR